MYEDGKRASEEWLAVVIIQSSRVPDLEVAGGGMIEWEGKLEGGGRKVEGGKEGPSPVTPVEVK